MTRPLRVFLCRQVSPRRPSGRACRITWRGFTSPFAQWMRETADQLEGMALESGARSRCWALAVLGAAG